MKLNTTKKHNKFPITHPKEMEDCHLPNKEFNTLVLRKLSELQENKDTKLSKMMKTIHTQIRNLTDIYKS